MLLMNLVVEMEGVFRVLGSVTTIMTVEITRMN